MARLWPSAVSQGGKEHCGSEFDPSLATCSAWSLAGVASEYNSRQARMLHSQQSPLNTQVRLLIKAVSKALNEVTPISMCEQHTVICWLLNAAAPHWTRPPRCHTQIHSMRICVRTAR